MESHSDDIFMSFDQSNDNKADSNEERQHRQTNSHHEAYRTVTVSRIHNEATSEDLEEFFTQFGTVEKVRFSTKVPKGKHQRYAFVTFASIDSANSALLNEPFIIKEKKVKVEPHRLGQDLDQSSGDNNRADDSNKNLRNGPRGHNVSHKVYRTVYVGQIGKNITSKDLEEFFAKFDTVEKVTRKGARKAPMGKPLGFAFVTFSSKDYAHSAALAMFNEPSRIGGEIGNDKSDGGSHEACRTVHVARIQQNTNPKDLSEFFTQFGAVEKVSIVTRNSNGEPLTNAFVTFASQDSAESAVLDESHTIKGEQVNVRHCTLKEEQDQDNGGYRAVSNEDWQQSHQAIVDNDVTVRESHKASRTVFISRISKDINSKDLKEFFAKFGAVEKVYNRTRDSKPLNYAFVTFVNKGSAEFAVMDEHPRIKGKIVHVQPYARKPYTVLRKKTINIGGTKSQVKIRNLEKHGEVERKRAEDKTIDDMVVEAENRSPPLMETPNPDPSMDMV